MWSCESCQSGVPERAAFCPACGRPLVRVSAGADRTATAVVVIVGLVLAVPLLATLMGLIASIAIPNLLDAIERSRQNRAVAEIRDMAQAVQAYQRDHGTFPVLKRSRDSGWLFGEVRELERALPPGTIRPMPAVDPWKRPYRYGFTAGGGDFCLMSGGRDGIRERPAPPEDSRATHCYESDIVWLNGGLVRWPEGRQKGCGSDGGE